MSDNMYAGGCRCGALRYQARGEPVFQNHCQCLDCQHVSGTGHGSYLTFPRDAVTQAGEAMAHGILADIGHVKHHGSCAACGSPVTLTFDGLPGAYTVHAASLDDPSMFRPQVVTYAKSAQSWDMLDPGLQYFKTSPNA